MEKTLVFTHRLELALRLVDTTTGRNVSGRTARILIDGEVVRFGEKADNVLILQGLGRTQFRLRVEAQGYEPMEQDVDQSALDSMLPLLELQLIPGEGYPYWAPLFTLEGTLPGIETLFAVRERDNAVLVRELEPRKRLLTVFNPHHLTLDRDRYALVDPDRHCCEPFRILKTVDDSTVKIDHILEMPFKNYFPICPMVMGWLGGDGGYRLRVPDDSSDGRWLVRCTVNGTAYYREIDFRKGVYPDWEVR